MSFAARARGGRAFYTETLRPPDTLYIVGSGHVGLALSRVMSMLDFRIVVFDQRPDVDTLTRNVFAHEKRVLSFDRVGRHVRSGDRSYVAIMTHSHRSDEAVLRQLFGKRLRYVGLMASPRKAELVFDRLRSEGVPERLLRNVRSPIGLPIASHTPAEIAISIAAEIIQTRNAGHR
jgi:xanthine dehydrogenase accessory factor